MPHACHFDLRPFLLSGTVVALLAGCGPHSGPSSSETPAKPKTTAGSAPVKAPEKTATNAPGTGAPTADIPKFTKPEHVRGIYLTAWSASSKKKMAEIYDMVSNSGINSVVIDVRDSGEMYWKTGIPLAAEVKANQNAITHPEKLLADLKAHNVYPIARIACFRDQFVPKHFPERGVQLANGKVWRDRSGHSWLDPYNKDNWKYIADTVDFALNVGFPEIQLDYVRFPSEGKSNTQRFPSKEKYGDPKALPEDVIAAFAAYIGEKVRARGAVYSVDIFGIISSTKGSEGIGQQLEKVAKPFDVLSPMIYPSHFAAGEYGIKAPNASQYEIITKSLTDYKKRLPNTTIRPWLQDFTIRVPNQPHVTYGVKEVQAQIKAAHDLGYDSFLLWNAGNKYTRGTVPKDK